MVTPRIDLIRVVVPERVSTPFADLAADPFLRLLYLPMVEVAQPWPFPPIEEDA